MANTYIFLPDGKPYQQHDKVFSIQHWNSGFPVYIQDWTEWPDGWYSRQVSPRGLTLGELMDHEIPKEAKAYMILLT